ncbi:MAG: hemerythrin domain-containing protein [Archangium sp.]|nr:hemerythrin domain-containing protein [Archangium sp.]
MPGPISSHFVAVHAQLDQALRECLKPPGKVDTAAFDQFRRLLLRHIAQEERVLMPALVKKLGSPPLFRNALRKDHAGFATLCVPLPEREWVENLGELFAHHAALEEGPGGLYPLCDEVLRDEAAAVIAAADALPPIKLAPFNGGPWVRDLLAEVLRATGIDGASD